MKSPDSRCAVRRAISILSPERRRGAPARACRPRGVVACALVPGLAALLLLAGGARVHAQTAAWTEITHPSSPAFAHHDMTYDSLRHRLVVAGRTHIMQNPFAAYAGTQDGVWTQLPAPDPPLPGRHDVELAYDAGRDVVVLYTDAGNEVWEFDGAGWNTITAATRPVQCGDGALLQYDPLRRTTVLVGCIDEFPAPGRPSETWLWDGGDWTRAADAGASPPGAAGGGMAFDSARGEMVLLTMGAMETWTFDGTSWTQRHPGTVPSPGIWVFDMAYDPASQRVVFFGGESTGEPLSYPQVTWAWDGTDWQVVDVPAAPPSDIDFAMAAFPELGGVMMHGGWGPGGSGPGYRTNMWLLTMESAPACAAVPAGLAGWWPGEGDAGDLVRGDDGVLENGATAAAAGRVGHAFAFDGVNDYVAFPTSDFSYARGLSLWVQSTRPGRAIIDCGPGAQQYWTWRVGLDSEGRPYHEHFRNGTGGYVRATAQTSVTDGQFHFIAIQTDNDAKSISVFVDGQEEGRYTETLPSFTLWAASAPGAVSLGRGTARDLPPSYFEGVADELLFFDRVLAAGDIAALYAAGGAGMCAWSPEIRFTEIRLVGAELWLVSAGLGQPGVAQILQGSAGLTLPNGWADVQANADPAATNTWLVPAQGAWRFFRIVQRP